VIIEPELSGNRLKETKMTQIAKKEMISKCGHEKIVVQMPEDWNQQERALVRTATGEPFMPARLYFKFINKKSLMKALERRNCIDLFDDDTFNISYWEEAKTVKLKVPYDEVPENVFPVLLARGSFVGLSEVHVDVKSFDRAIGILKFLNKYIGPKFMYVTHIATYNRFTGTQDAEDILNFDYDEIFSEEKLQQAEQDFSKFSPNENKDSEEAREKFEAMLKQPIPVVRRVPVKNTQADLNQLQVSLTFAQLFAKTYWDGKEDFGPIDMLSLMFESDKSLKIEDVQE
jgi:hypothetical protein